MDTTTAPAPCDCCPAITARTVINAWAETTTPARAEAMLARLARKAEDLAAAFPGSTIQADLTVLPGTVARRADAAMVRVKVLAGTWRPAAV